MKYIKTTRINNIEISCYFYMINLLFQIPSGMLIMLLLFVAPLWLGCEFVFINRNGISHFYQLRLNKILKNEKLKLAQH